MAQLGGCNDWVNGLDTNEHGRRCLTLHKAMSMAADGGQIGWYIAPFAMQWTIGRMATDEERYHVLLESGEPVTFQHSREAKSFLSGLLEAGVYIDSPPHVAEPSGSTMCTRLSKDIGRALCKHWRLGASRAPRISDMAATFNYWLVFVSLQVGILAICTGLDLTARIAASRTAKAARAWLTGGAISMGTGALKRRTAADR